MLFDHVKLPEDLTFNVGNITTKSKFSGNYRQPENVGGADPSI
jgi:hypothetical protein